MRTNVMIVAAALSFCLLSGGAATAQEDGAPHAAAKDAQATRMVAAFKDWAVRYGVPDASFAVMRGEDVIGSAKVGARKATRAEPVASLSKAITGVCIAKLVEAGKLGYRDRIGKLLPGYFRKNKPIDLAAKQITVAELLTHSGGIAYDPTQGATEFVTYDFSKTNMPKLFTLALTKSLAAKTFAYNNVNYVGLGLVIEAVTGEDYETYCGRTVLQPAGAGAAKLNPAWRIMGAFGGWRISAVDYARFLDHFRPGSKLLKSKPNSWPKYDLGNGVFYSIGVVMRRSGNAYNFWHAGDWVFNDPKRKQSYGAYEAVLQQNLRWVANYAPFLGSSAAANLDNTIYQAAFPSASQASRAAATASAPLPTGPGGWSDDGSTRLGSGLLSGRD